MDSIMSVEKINVIQVHKDSFDTQIIDNYNIKKTSLKDSIILTKLK